jgi:hypothetical protein
MSFQCFIRKAREIPWELERRRFPSGKRTCSLQCRGYSYLSASDKEIPPCGEHPLPSILSLLPSVTKTEGKAEKAFRVAVTLQVWPQPHEILPALKPKYL